MKRQETENLKINSQKNIFQSEVQQNELLYQNVQNQKRGKQSNDFIQPSSVNNTIFKAQIVRFDQSQQYQNTNLHQESKDKSTTSIQQIKNDPAEIVRKKLELKQKIAQSIKERQRKKVEQLKQQQQIQSSSLPSSKSNTQLSISKQNQIKYNKQEIIVRPDRAPKQLEIPKGACTQANSNQKGQAKFYAPDPKNKQKALKLRSDNYGIEGYSRFQNIKNQLKGLSPNNQNLAKNFFSYLPAFAQRKKKKVGQKTDLKVCSLSENVGYAHKQGIILLQDYQQYLSFKGPYVQKDFLKQFAQNRLTDYKFSKSKITLFDFRRLTTLVALKNPSLYKLGERPFSIHSDIFAFLNEIYKLQETQYWQKCFRLDKKYRLFWWKAIIDKFSKLLPQNIIDLNKKVNEEENQAELIQNQKQKKSYNQGDQCQILPNFKLKNKNPRQQTGAINLSQLENLNKTIFKPNKPRDQKEDQGDSNMNVSQQQQQMQKRALQKKNKFKKFQLSQNKKFDDEENLGSQISFQENDLNSYDMSIDDYDSLSKSSKSNDYKNNPLTKNMNKSKLIMQNDQDFFSSVDQDEQQQILREPKDKKIKNKKNQQHESDEQVNLDEFNMNSDNQNQEDQQQYQRKKPQKIIKNNNYQK